MPLDQWRLVHVLGGGQQRVGSLGMGGMSLNNRNKPALPLGLVKEVREGIRLRPVPSDS